MAYRDSTTASGASATPSVAVPAGVAIGDIVILACATDASAADFQAADWPTGFTELEDSNITADGQSFGIAWKRLTAADSGSYTLGNIGASADWVCQAFAFSGRHATDPPVVGAPSIDSTLSNTPQAPSANGVTAVDGDDLLWICAPDVDSSGGYTAGTLPGTYSAAEDTENAWTTLFAGYKNNVSAGATGSVAGSFTHVNQAGWAATLVRIPVAAAGGGTTILRQMNALYYSGPS